MGLMLKVRVIPLGLSRKLLLTEPTWPSLVSSITSWYPEFSEKEMVVCYEDLEGDEVVVLDDNDVQLMMQQVHQDDPIDPERCRESSRHDEKILRLTIKSREEVRCNPSIEEDMKEDRLIDHCLLCVVCHRAIVGFRFVCLICNTDLCSRCGSIGLHPRHVMLRLCDNQSEDLVQSTRRLWREGLEVQRRLERERHTERTSARKEREEMATETTSTAISHLQKEIDKLLNPLLAEDDDDDVVEDNDLKVDHNYPEIRDKDYNFSNNEVRDDSVSPHRPSSDMLDRCHRSRSPIPVKTTDEMNIASARSVHTDLSISRPTSLSLSRRACSSSSPSKVSEALATMLTMGFDDNGGWLTELLTLKRGNVDDVLDMLSPVHAQQYYTNKVKRP